MINIHPFTPTQSNIPTAPDSFTAEASGTSRNGGTPALTVMNAVSAPAGAEEVTEAVEADCARRDDALGKLVSAIFQYPAPPMPQFR
ncbi:MAG: hypothetical protein J6Z49_01275 [Kiritimatiellae bacterium]|nr:hypothetical protein [Kiritimatiellia bacterium]